MITVPVLAPRRELKWAKPPNVLTGIDTRREARFQMQKAIHEGLHMQTVDEPNGAHPEKTCPTEEKVTEKNRNDDQRNLKFGPRHVSRADQVRAPLLH